MAQVASIMELDEIPWPGRQRAEEGIVDPVDELLKVDSYIYRFSNDRTNFGYGAGAWWIREEDFNAIMARAKLKGVDLGQQARWDMAVLQSWGNKMNMAVQARVTGRLWAWTGTAKPQREKTPNGQLIEMFGEPSIRQLYLDDLLNHPPPRQPGDLPGEKGVGWTTLSRETLAITGAKYIPSAPIY